MPDETSIFGAAEPLQLLREWMGEAETTEPNDPNAMSLATVDADGMPNVRIVLLKEIEAASVVFYTNYDSTKGREIAASGVAAVAIHWKSLRRQVRLRGHVTREDGAQADAYYASRGLDSRLGAWASRQSQPLQSREALLERVEDMRARFGDAPPRPPFWGGFRITPVEMEFWADGSARLHDRERWVRAAGTDDWYVKRLSP